MTTPELHGRSECSEVLAWRCAVLISGDMEGSCHSSARMCW